MMDDPSFVHDLLNRIGAAKMNAEMAARDKNLSEPVKKNLERVLANLLQMQQMVDPVQPAKNLALDSTRLTTASEKSILLIDDSEDLRALFKVYLEPKGYSVSVAKNQQEALFELSQPPYPQLVLLDYNLGDCSGSDVLDALQKLGSKALTESKIVLFTGFGNQVQDPRVYATEPKSMDLNSLMQLIEKYF